MSRTKIYMMDDNMHSILSNGSNAIDNQLFTNKGVGFVQTFLSNSSKPAVYADELSESFIADFDISVWLNENNTCTTNVNSNLINSSNDIVTMDYVQNMEELEKTYSLDDIINEKAFSPASSSGVSSLDTPLPSPLSNSIDFELENFLNEATSQQNNLLDFSDDNQEPDSLFDASDLLTLEQSIDTELSQQQCFIPDLDMIQNDGNTNDIVIDQIGSPDSGVSGSDDILVNQDLLLQLISQGLIYNQSEDNLISEESSSDQESTFSDLYEQGPQSVESCSGKIEIIVDKSNRRAQPYKRKQRTEEQKSRKKVQNRNAAIKYRSKKKGELQIMLEEEEELASKNKDLHGKVNGLQKEVEYLKMLMLDVIKARLDKGQKNSSSALEILLKSSLSV